MLLLLFPLQNAQCREIILYLLECLQSCLTISRDSGVIMPASLPRERATPAAIEEGLRDRRPNRPEAARPTEPILRRSRFHACQSAEREGGIVGCLGNSDLL